ncbi:troponin C-like isoform X1 [Tachypleus tridentatus]|uniref:troponin C-like isoform X1 n=1 Tax=Tachypleus tridentatus TaxID=6853 RepID=UPI003FD499F4
MFITAEKIHTRNTLYVSVLGRKRSNHVKVLCQKRYPYVRNSGGLTAEDLTKEQVQMLRKAFDMFDREKKGVIHTNMVSTILRTLGQTFEEKDLKDLISEIDQDGSGELEFEEFMALAARFLVEEDAEAMQEELREAFRLYDKQGQGYINVSDLRDILRALDDKLTEDELDEMIAEIDTDGSGTVDFDEFMEMMTGE